MANQVGLKNPDAPAAPAPVLAGFDGPDGERVEGGLPLRWCDS